MPYVVIRIGKVVDESSIQVSYPNSMKLLTCLRVRCTHREVTQAMVEEIEKAKNQGDTLGGEIEVYASGVPVGLGSYAHWDRRLEGKIAQAFLSLNAIKGVEIGIGFTAATLPGSQVHDEIYQGQKERTVRFETNRSSE